MSHFIIGVVLARQGQKAEALKSFEAGRAIAARLVQLDPSNAIWRQDLSRFEQEIRKMKEGQLGIMVYLVPKPFSLPGTARSLGSAGARCCGRGAPSE